MPDVPQTMKHTLPTQADLEALFTDGILQEVNRRLLHPRGLALGVNPATSTVMLFTDDDPEGWVYSNDPEANAEWVEKAAAKAERFDALLRPEREERLGYVIQPLPEADRG